MGTDSFLPSKIDKLENWDINEDKKNEKNIYKSEFINVEKIL